MSKNWNLPSSIKRGMMQEALAFIDGINEVRSCNTDNSSVTVMVDSNCHIKFMNARGGLGEIPAMRNVDIQGKACFKREEGQPF